MLLPLAAATLATAALGAVAAWGAVSGTVLVSRASGPAGAAANGSTDTVTPPTLSTGARWIAFQSTATNLDPADTDSDPDIYVRDTETGTTTLVSRADGAAGAKGDGASAAPVISADGRYVAFESSSDNLDPDEPDGIGAVFVRDLQLHTTRLVSRRTGASGAASPGREPSISANGRSVAFESEDSIDADDGATIEIDVHVRDLVANTTATVSRSSGGALGSSNSFNPSISPNGRYVAFESQATNLDPADASNDTDIYVRDLTAGTTVLASRATGAAGAKANQDSGIPAMSNAPSVAFETRATNLDPADAGGTPGFDVFVRNVATHTTALASRAGGAAGAHGDSGSRWPAIAADGNRVAFESDASNLDPADPDATTDLFVRDLAAGTTLLASVASSGAKANNASHLAAISPDGRYAAFESAASNLVAGTLGRQIFARELASSAGSGPSGGGTAGGGGPAGGGGGATAPPAKARLAGRKRLHVSRKGRFTFRFRATPGLAGRAVFRSAGKVRTSTRKRVRLARKAFHVPSSGRVKLKVTLSRKSRRILNRNHRRIRTRVTVTLRDGTGRTSRASRTITLRR